MTTSPRPPSDETITIPGRDWRLAACRHADPELFFPVSASGPSLDQVTQAKAIYAGCPVRRQCLAFALDSRQDHGVWGGISEQQRGPGHGRHLKEIQATTLTAQPPRRLTRRLAQPNHPTPPTAVNSG
jgi:WhiB family redox-sensing transcriptional regulator